jgi:hypothetical protein
MWVRVRTHPSAIPEPNPESPADAESSAGAEPTAQSDTESAAECNVGLAYAL